MQKQVGGAAEGGVRHHGILQRSLGKHIVGPHFQLMQAQDRAGGTASRIEPYGLARGSERGVGQGHAQGFCDYLRGRCCS